MGFKNSSRNFVRYSLGASAMLVAVFSSNAMADKVYVSDQGHTEVMFGWDHVGVTRQNAEFTKSEITVNLADNIEDSTVEVTIDANSVSSGFEKLDDHLKTADFLEVETYPNLTFTSTGIKKTGETTMDVTGDLTIHGVTQSVVLKAEVTHKGEHPIGKNFDHYKGEWLGILATTEIDHQSFDVGSFSTGPIAITVRSELKGK